MKQKLINTRIEDIMYRAGLTAQGCWDELDSYDRNAIMTFAELIVRECMWKIMQRKEEAIDNDWRADEAMSAAISDIAEHFGVEE